MAGEGPRARDVSSRAAGPPLARDAPVNRSTTKEVVEIRSTSMNTDDPTVEEVVRCEDLPPGSLADRRMIVRWSDGTQGEAVRFYQAEVLFSEGDHGNSGLMSSRVEPETTDRLGG
jgi:hypothetical protein